MEKVIRGLECLADVDGRKYKYCLHCAYRENVDHCAWNCHEQDILRDAIALLEAQGEVIEELRRVGYPHDFQNEKPWIQDYMRLITEIIKKAVALK